MANASLEKASLVGGALAAIVASVCCLGPLVLVTVGISGAWISNLVAFEPYRPYAVGVALICMIFAYRKIYAAPEPEACEPGTLCSVPQTRRIYRDRKSTRLNSSHQIISYAVFFLQKNKRHTEYTRQVF